MPDTAGDGTVAVPAASRAGSTAGGSGVGGGAPYRMSISLNVLNHLGLNLYSNHPAVLSEVVANAWDADATEVAITLDLDNETVVVADNGDGMTLADINERFLHVGYQRRRDEATRTSRSGRPVMGRKGIGKLSLFSIARTVVVETARDGEKHALRMDLDDIEKAISGGDPSTSGAYEPEPLDPASVDFEHGTRITLTNLKRSIAKTNNYLARRLARRFSVLGKANNFVVKIGDHEITADDIDLLGMVQYLWTYDDTDASMAAAASKKENLETRKTLTEHGVALRGWLGTVANSGTLRDNGNGDDLNRITVMVRGKLAQEDLLSEYNEGGIYRAYLVGELHADFLDLDDEDDIATSSRQRIREDDPRFEALVSFVQQELKHIQSKWTALRTKDGTDAALMNPAIKDWFATLTGDTKKKAQQLFGKINQITVDDEKQRRDLFAHGVLAFETMRQRESLDAFDSLEPTDLASLNVLFAESSQLEAALYHRLVQARLSVIRKLDDLHEDEAKEKFLQQHIHGNLWLLDPGWERATDTYMEESVAKLFDSLGQKAPKDEAAARLDIRYQKTSGTNVIVELKKSDVTTSTGKLLDQIGKYRSALRKALDDAGRQHEGIEVVCLVGRELTDWAEQNGRAESAESMRAKSARVVMYQELLANAHYAYQAYLDASKEVGRIQKVLDALAEEADPDADDPPPVPVKG